MTVGDLEPWDAAAALACLLAPGFILGLGLALAAHVARVPRASLARAAVLLAVASGVAFVLAAATDLPLEARRWLVAPAALALAGAAVGTMAMATGKGSSAVCRT